MTEGQVYTLYCVETEFCIPIAILARLAVCYVGGLILRLMFDTEVKLHF